MNDTTTLAGKVAFFLAQRQALERLAPVPDLLSPSDIAEGYAVLEGVHDGLATHGVARVGYKIGCTTPETQAGMGVSEPIWAGLLDRGRSASIAEGLARIVNPAGVECEIALTLGRDLVEPVAELDERRLREAVSGCSVGCELIENRYGGIPRERGIPTLLADDFLQAGFVLGPDVPGWRGLPLETLEGYISVDGTVMGRGVASSVMGGPFASLRWLAGALAARGRILRAGEIVLTGSLVAPVWIGKDAGEVEIGIEGLGTLR